MLDSGSGHSILDLCTVEALGLKNDIIPKESSDDSMEKPEFDLLDASGNKMNIVGSVPVTVTIPGLPDKLQTFCVLDAIFFFVTGRMVHKRPNGA